MNKVIVVSTVLLSLFFIFLFKGKDTFPDYKIAEQEFNNLEIVDFDYLYYKEENFFNFPEFHFPVVGKYRISSEFGNREVIVKGIGGEQGDFHRGIDIVPKENGAKVYAVSSGVIEMHYPPPSRKFKGHPVFGGFIVIRHGNGIFTAYGHMKETFVSTGQYVKKDEIIGVVGNTGISTGTHLHFEILLDPTVFFGQ